MKALGLSNTQLIIAIIFGVLIGFTVTAVTAPHLVEVPVQVITPVPTPPPVVITEQPVEQQHSSGSESPWNTTYGNINNTVGIAFNMMALGLIILGFGIMIAGMFLLRGI